MFWFKKRSKKEKKLRTLYALLLKMAFEAKKHNLHDFKIYQQKFSKLLNETLPRDIINKEKFDEKKFMLFDEIRNLFTNSLQDYPNENEEEKKKRQREEVKKGIRLLKKQKEFLKNP